MEYDWPRVFDRAKLIRMSIVNGDIMIRSVLAAPICQLPFLTFGTSSLPLNQPLHLASSPFMPSTAFGYRR
jgi:MATE family multidrug resistance protein